MPPEAPRLAEYALFTVPSGSVAVVTARSAGAIVTRNVAFAFAPAPSLTAAAIEYCPAVVGVPLIAPDAVALSPSGRPDALYVYGGTPPEALS